MRLGSFIISACLFIFCSVTAQGQKLAHVNTQEILSELPEVQKAQQKLQTFSEALDKQYQELNTEYMNKLDKYQSEAETMAESVRKMREEELSELQSRIQRFQQQAQGDVAQKRQELLEPILGRVEDTIERVAKENGYTMVMDSSTGAVVYADESTEITAKVKAALGVQ